MPVDFDPNRLTAAMRREIMHGVMQATELVRTEAVRLVLSTEKTGRIYGSGRTAHQASAPGEPWASDTGFALSQIKAHYEPAQLLGRVTIDADYGLFLELGTQRMAARPVLRPALANKTAEATRLIENAVDRALESAGR